MKNWLYMIACFIVFTGCEKTTTEQIVEEQIKEESRLVNGLLLPAGFELDTTAVYDSVRKADIQIVTPVSKNNKFNRIIADSINFYKQDFLLDIVEFPGGEFSMENFFSIWPEKIILSDTISAAFVVEQYYAGAAHSYSQYFTINYDTTNNMLLTFEKTFEINSPEDTAIFLTQVNKILGKSELLLDRVHPLNFLFTPDSVIFYFDNYEVGPYAAGLPKAAVHRKELKKISK